jgi:hypothetical protein
MNMENQGTGIREQGIEASHLRYIASIEAKSQLPSFQFTGRGHRIAAT